MGKFAATIALTAALMAGVALSTDRAGAIGTSAARPGVQAPTFSAPDINGRTIGLGDYAGKIVILEWTNDGCPFVGKHLRQRQYAGAAAQIYRRGRCLAGPLPPRRREQGHVTPAEAKADLARWRAAPSEFLLDPNGAVGRLYDARATPHMVVIDRNGRIAYMGAIDDTPSTSLADVKTAKNYLVAALDEIAAGKPVTVAATQAYGCSIKYKGT